MIRGFLCAALALLAMPAAAATIELTPSNASVQLNKAKCGDVVIFTAGQYGTVNTPRIVCPNDNRLRIKAADATIATLFIRASVGLDWNGGHVTGSSASTAGVTIDTSRFVMFADARVTGPRIAITAVRSTDLEITRNTLDGYRSDGINITQVQRVAITYNQMRNMTPIRATYSAAGKLLVDGDHADCVQGWTTTGTPPTADILIEYNSCIGETQGYTFFNGGAGGYDNIVIRYNFAEIQYWHGITVVEGRSTVIRGNVVRTSPGARAQNYPFQPIKAWISSLDGKGETICGNVVQALPTGLGTQPCPTAAD